MWQNFPGGPVPKTPHSQCRRLGWGIRSCMLQLRWGQSNRYIKILIFKKKACGNLYYLFNTLVKITTPLAEVMVAQAYNLSKHTWTVHLKTCTFIISLNITYASTKKLYYKKSVKQKTPKKIHTTLHLNTTKIRIKLPLKEMLFKIFLGCHLSWS